VPPPNQKQPPAKACPVQLLFQSDAVKVVDQRRRGLIEQVLIMERETRVPACQKGVAALV